MNRLFFSLAVRQAAISTILVIVAIVGFGTFAVISVRQGARADLLHTIDTDLAGLTDVMVQGGERDLRQRIADRLSLTAEASAVPFYRLSDRSGHLLAGNLPSVSMLDPAHSGVAQLQIDGVPILARATTMREGLILIVGRSLEPSFAVERRLGRTLAGAAVAVSLLSLAIGLLTARNLMARVNAVNDAFARFAKGERASRLQISPRADEMDHLVAQVDAHLDRIERLLVAQRDITDTVAHELRTPLVHLDTRLLAALEQNGDEGVARTLDMARADIRSVVSLFDALLDIAMVDPTGNAARAGIDLSEIAANIGDLYAASAEEADLAFLTRVAPGVSMRGEAMQMTRLIANLLDNAFKYVPAGSRVLLSVEPGPIIIVEDNGLGIPEQDRERVFERFRRSAQTGNGHGLGLALVRVIAARHGLTACIEDAAPGARFVIAPVRST